MPALEQDKLFARQPLERQGQLSESSTVSEEFDALIIGARVVIAFLAAKLAERARSR